MASIQDFASTLEITIEAICASPMVKDYIVGITAKPKQRKRSYGGATKNGPWPHFAILAPELSSKKALDLEGELQKRLQSRRDRCGKKYCEIARGPHRRSLGGTEHYAYSLYIAWR